MSIHVVNSVDDPAAQRGVSVAGRLPGQGDFSRQAHSADGGSSRLQQRARVCRQKRRSKSAELTARAGDPPHFRAAIADEIGPVSVGYHICLSGEDHHAVPGLCQLPGQGTDRLRGLAPASGVHPPAFHVQARQHGDLGQISPDTGHRQTVQQQPGGGPPQRAGTHAHRVQQDGVAQSGRFLPRRQHTVHGPGLHGPQIQAQAPGTGGDLRRVGRLVRQDGAGSAGQQHIGHIICGDIIGDTMDQRSGLPQAVQITAQHKHSSRRAIQKKRALPVQRSGKASTLCSLPTAA